MPKSVDHDQRRIEIIEATWRIVARGGFDAATMRQIAAEAGFANGGTKPYFGTKDELLAASYDRTFYLVNERAGDAIGDLWGLDAVRLLLIEMLPLDEQRAIESRVAMAFWDRAASSDQLRKVHADSYAIWRHWMDNELTAARRRGRLSPDRPISDTIDELLALVTGLRVQAVMAAGGRLTEDRLRILDRALDRLRADPQPIERSESEVPMDRGGVHDEVFRRS